jgi:hypothetical protein
MICATCFAENAESASVCAKCGRALPQIVPEPKEGLDQAAAKTDPAPAAVASPVFRDPVPLQKWTIGLLLCFGAVLVVSAGFDVAQLRLISAVEMGAFASDAELVAAVEANDARQQVIVVLHPAFFIATAVAFGMWIHRMATNARAFTVEPFDITPGWAVGTYIIPIINLWMPYRAMSEIWRASRNPAGWKADRAGEFLGWWWAIWLVSNIFGRVARILTDSEAETIPELRQATYLSLASIVLLLGSVAMGVALVRRLTVYQMQASTGKALHKVFE